MITHPTRAYIICAGARTGSNLLATALRHTGVAGKPHEFFEARLADQPYMRNMLRIPEDEYFTTFSDRLGAILEGGTTRNGVFGATVHWHQINPLLTAVGGQDDRSAHARGVATLRGFFPDLKFIWLRRENKVAQGISHYVAIKTKRWQVFSEEPESEAEDRSQLPFDFAELDHLVDDARAMDDSWREFLEESRQQTLEVTYEELSADFPDTVGRVLDHLGVSLGARPLPQPRYRKQADARSKELERRYLAQLRAEGREPSIYQPLGAGRESFVGEGAPAAPPVTSTDLETGPAPAGETGRRVCFVTTEFHGLFRNGGIGTANTGLALALAAAGFDVTVTFANADENGPRPKIGDFASLKAEYADRGITLDYVPPQLPGAFSDPRTASYSVYAYLLRRSFDAVLFNDNGGLGFYALQAKHTGVYPDAPRMIVVTHGPQDWVLSLNALPYYSRIALALSFMERRSVELADALVSPSQYLVDWMTHRGWALPKRTLVIQNILPLDAGVGPGGPPSQIRPVEEIVFFGRQEIRKGLALFCDAIDRLHLTDDLRGVRVTFLGKFDRLGGLHSGVYLAERARLWRCTLRIVTTFDQAEALSYLTRAGRLAVIPSLAENSPCVVAECLATGLPFLATETGGTAELVAEERRAQCLFAPTAEALAARLSGVLASGHSPALAAVDQKEATRRWLTLVSSVIDTRNGKEATEAPDGGGANASAAPQRVGRAARRAAPAAASADSPDADAPLVSVCLARGSSRDVACLPSLALQSCASVEVILVEPEDTRPPDHPDSVRHIPLAHEGRAAGRNGAAAQARGRYLAFVDESSASLEPDCLAQLSDAARITGADIVTCLQRPPADWPERRMDAGAHPFPIGAAADLGALENAYGGKVFLVSAERFRRGPGFDETCEDAYLDWVFLAASVLGGARLEVAPQPLVSTDERSSPTFDAGSTVRGHRSVMRAYADQSASVFGRLVEPLWQVNTQYEGRLKSALAGLGEPAKAKALAISKLDPDSADARRGFVEYCYERRMIDLAVDFAMFSRTMPVSDAVEVAQREREAAALSWIGERKLEFPQVIALDDRIRGTFRAIAPLRQADLRVDTDGLVAHAIGTDIRIVKAAAACPPGTRSLTVRATIDARAGATAAVAIALATPDGRLILTEEGLSTNAGGGWSGWAEARRSEAVARVDLATPARELLDLFLLSRSGDHGGDPEAVVTWTTVEATVALSGDMTASAIERRTQLTPIGEDTISNARLVTETEPRWFNIRPGGAILTHPIAGQILLARMEAALPVGASGLRCVVSVQHEKAGPVDFAVWIHRAASVAASEADLAAHAAFSGWMTVDKPLERRQLTVRLATPVTEAMDLYFGVRASEGSTTAYCWAHWHEFLVMSPTPEAMRAGASPSGSLQPKVAEAHAGVVGARRAIGKAHAEAD